MKGFLKRKATENKAATIDLGRKKSLH